MDKMRIKSTSKDSSKSARTTKSASASHSSPVSKSIVKNFMKGLMTTEELLKKKENKNKGLVKIRLAVSSADMKKMPEMLINKEFNLVVKELKKTNNKPLNF